MRKLRERIALWIAPWLHQAQPLHRGFSIDPAGLAELHAPEYLPGADEWAKKVERDAGTSREAG